MMATGMNLITTVIGFGMSATFIVFVCTRLICGRLRRDESRRTFELDSRIDVEQPEHRVSGLEPVLVAAIPTMKFDQKAFSSLEDAQCSICLGEYQEREVLRIMPKCGHNFHLSCIDTWLRKRSTCPVCRLHVQDSVLSKSAGTIAFETTSSFQGSELSMDNSHRWLIPNADHLEQSRDNIHPSLLPTIPLHQPDSF
ncbi:RING-H2 finger protein ATL39-like [Rhodamnia argentea]|uniref:RING-H2 finger protein ATL39-like n=1 Tax=Rhodamnia argentea TaxID=178133 RepID=A0A8B8PI59_9MYRT|nr:RING-H2 finger protein ATL39-like [Rhodamnia argentea]